MSAWIVNREHIDVLVTALQPVVPASAPQPADYQDNGNKIGRILWRECLNSVAYRYPNDGDGERPGPSDFRDSDVDTYVWTRREVPPCWIYQAAACYGYQSCEHPGWEASEAHRWIELLQKQHHRHKNKDYDYNRPAAADNPPWGIDARNLAELAASQEGVK